MQFEIPADYDFSAYDAAQYDGSCPIQEGHYLDMHSALYRAQCAETQDEFENDMASAYEAWENLQAVRAAR